MHPFNSLFQVFQMLCNQAGLAIENSRLYEMIIEKSNKDSLTNLWNHGYFQKKLSEILTHAKKKKLPTSLMVIDIAPKFYPIHHDVILEGLKDIDIDKISKRQEADDELAEYVESATVRQFLLKNLKRNARGYEWKMNLDVIYNNIANVGKGLEPDDKFNHKTLFVRGALSQYILDEDLDGLKKHFPDSNLVTIHGASHWVHYEKPDELSSVIEEFLLLK